MVYKLLRVCANANVLSAAKTNRHVVGGLDIEQDHRPAVHVPFVNLHIDWGLELRDQPVLQLLVPDLLLSRAEGRADNCVTFVVNSPEDVRCGLAVQRRSIR